MANPNPNPNPFGNQNDWSFTNLMNFGQPNTVGSSSSSPIRGPNQQPTFGFANFSQPQSFPPLDFNQQQFLNQYLQQQQLLQQLLAQQQQTQPQQEQPIEETPTQQRDTGGGGGASKRRSHKKKDKGVAREKCNKQLWTANEELWLTKCWIDASEDARRGNSQRLHTLWGTIHEKFNNNDQGWVRRDDQLTGKWRYIDRACKDFNAIYNEEERHWGSGRGDDDIYERAVVKFHERYIKPFVFKHCWEFLKDKPKWYAPPAVGGSGAVDVEDYDDIGENQTLDLSDDPISTQRPNELFGDDPFPRPIGRERAKKAARSGTFFDAATSSHGKASSGTNSEKMEEFIGNINSYKSAFLEKKTQTMDLIAEEEKMRSALEATKFLATIDTLHITDPHEKKRVMKMKKKLIERYRDYIQISDDEDEADE